MDEGEEANSSESSLCYKDKTSYKVNVRGAVRPKQYNSKYKRLKVCTDNKLKQPTGEDSESHDLYLSFGSEKDSEEQSSGEGINENHPSHSKEQQTHACDSDEEEGQKLENDFIEFLKCQEETVNLEVLMSELEKEQAWYEQGKDDDSGEDEDDLDSDLSKNSELDEDKPIQPGHYLTVGTSVLLIWLFVITHSLTSTQIMDLLTLLSLHMMHGYPALKSLHRFKRFFSHMKSPFRKHFYCSFCNFPVKYEEQICQNSLCNNNLKKDGAKEYFLELPVISQLQALYSRSEFYQGLSHKKQRIKRSDNNIEDVYDGNLYKNLLESCQDKATQHLTFTFNTDGIPIFKSSKMSLWPIFLMVNELPYKMRKSRENMILCGIWFGQQKPEMNIFGGPLMKEMQVFSKGITIYPWIHGEKKEINITGYLYCISCDTPARNSVLNMNQHNGSTCCPKCLQPGENFRTSSGGNIHVFPYQQENPTCPKRTPAEVLDDVEKARVSGKAVNGIKGPSFLSFCPRFDPVRGVAIDYMHLICLGVVRTLTNLWFGVANGFQNFSLYKFVDVVDQRLVNIKPSHRVTRKPRSISEHLKFWKAAEFRSWFFYYSLPCIYDLLRPDYLYHYCSLLEGIFLLNTESISENDLRKSEHLLQYFVFMVPCLYGERYMTLNFHSLLHLPDTVRHLGPLWSFSCFPFESANGELTNFFHGTQYIDIQIVNAVHVFQILPSLSEHVDKSSSAYSLVQSLLKRNCSKSNSCSFKPFGKGYHKDVDSCITALICKRLKRPFDNMLFYSRAILRGAMYHSLDYSRVTKRNSYTVKFNDDNSSISYGFICWFSVEQTEKLLEPELLVCIEKFKSRNVEIFNMHHEKETPDEYVQSNFMNLSLSHLHCVSKTDTKCVVPARHVLDLCMCIEISNDENFLVVCDDPNHQELNL